MKQLLFLGLLLGWFSLRAQPVISPGPAVTVEVSRTHSLVRFVQTMAGGSGTHVGSRWMFEHSRFNTPAARRWLRRYQALDYDPGFDRDGYPADRLGSTGSIMPGYLAASADARDLSDLQRRTVGLLPNEVLVSLDSVYRYFEPTFDTLAWQPHAAELARLQTAYAQFLAQSQLMREFGRLRTFYGGVWPDALPFRVLLNSQLGPGSGFTNKASVSGNVVLLNCNPASREFVGGSTVMFHEMCHALSTQQRLSLQQQLEGWFLHNASPNRRYAYNLLEEALATAAGEWIHARQTGQPETGEWYNDDYINRYAHALYPLVAAYTDRSQPIDSAFVGQAVRLFDKDFPQAATEYGNLFRNVLYWTDAEDFDGAIQAFRSQLRSTYTYSGAPILNSAKHLASARSGEHLPVIMVTQQHEATLKYLRQQLPALRAHRLRPEQSFVLSTSGPSGPLILVNVHDPAQLATAAKLLEQQRRMNPKEPLKLLK
ncbi:hypothetical protein MON38_11860 [Hymenobacter sp. DH14]|uniref:DUF4932 domain-containing protein n=1 Tax=Hymenobacter cyanobacteriorum TaxID=2926463 RepID=A0A9X1VGD4_9BACT|nr:hypothetical protein [Hymenobacter cyanobacteriorum]MCI1188115.1 hypothetical protein [Hymenobacter cyanobacteriorum]